MLVNGKPIDYSPLPQHMQGGMKLYLEHGIEPGGFLTSVLANDLRGAVKRADSINKHFLLGYIDWLLEFAPHGSWGSYDLVNLWIYKHAEERKKDQEEMQQYQSGTHLGD